MVTVEKMKNDLEINLLELAQELIKKAGIILLCAVLAGGGTFLGEKLFASPQYESTTKIYVLTKQDNNILTSGDMQTSTLLAKDYVEMIKSRDVTEEAIRQLNLSITHEQMLEKMDISTLTDTRIVVIKVRDQEPENAAKIAETIENVAVTHIQNVMNVEAVNVAEKANVPMVPVSPVYVRDSILAALLGAMAAAMVLTVRFLGDDTIRSLEDIEKYLEISTLGAVPLADGIDRKR